MAESYTRHQLFNAASERAIFDTVGRNYPIFFIGNAPIGYLPLLPLDGRVFFQLAQVVDDPWPLKKLPGVLDFAWMTKSEAQEHVDDARMAELLGRML